MELHFDLSLLSALNLKTADWDSEETAEIYSNYISVFFTVLVILLPLILFALYCYKDSKQWADDDFVSKYGILLDGTIVMKK